MNATASLTFANDLHGRQTTITFDGTKEQAESWLAVKSFVAGDNIIGSSLVTHMTDAEAEEYFWTIPAGPRPTGWRYTLLRLLTIEP